MTLGQTSHSAPKLPRRCAHGCSDDKPANTVAPKTVPADFVVDEAGEKFVIRLVKPEQIELARARVAGTKPQGIVSGRLADGDGGFNAVPKSKKKWTWHLVPESVSFPQVAMELCDGRPSDVEAHKEHWIRDVKMYCPWRAKIVKEIK